MPSIRQIREYASQTTVSNELLQSLGLLKKPTKPRPKKKAAAHGHTVTNT